MTVSEDVVARAHFRDLAVTGGTVDRDVLAEGVVVADLREGRAAFPFQVLRLEADTGEGEDFVGATESGIAVDDDV